jgi:hypothetical protein
VFSALTLEHGDAVHYDAMDIAHAGAANEQEQMLEAQVNATLRTVEGLIGVEAQDSDAHLIGATTLLSRAKALANRATKRITEYSSQQLIDTLGEQLRAMRFIAQRTNGTRALEAVRTYATLAWVAGLQGAVPDADAGKHMRAMFADLKARAERVRGNVLSAKDGVVIGDAASPQLRPVNHVQHGKNWAGLLMTYETAHMQTSAARLREQAAAAASNYDRDVTRVLTVLASKHGGAQVYTFLEAFVAQIETLAP